VLLFILLKRCQRIIL